MSCILHVVSYLIVNWFLTDAAVRINYGKMDSLLWGVKIADSADSSIYPYLRLGAAINQKQI
jgi:hypothetical protein